jgi:hypothetical protein
VNFRQHRIRGGRTTPAWVNRASVVRDASLLGSPEVSITAYTLIGV